MPDDAEALESLRRTICVLFPPGPVRERWLRWAEQLPLDDGRADNPTDQPVTAEPTCATRYS
jgi:hypothetical protein